MGNTMEKKKISRVLAINRDWHNVKDCLPPANTPVVIRFMDPSLIYGENETEVYVAEDTKIGRCIRDFDDPDNIKKCAWVIDPPFPKYDFSMLSEKEKIKEGSVVTHWAEPSQEDLNFYYHRFDFKFKYDFLRFEVDPEIEEDMYRAIVNGAAALSYMYGTEEPEEQAAKDQWHLVQIWRELLSDLQKCIDDSVYMKNGQVIKLSVPDDPEDEEGGFPVANRTDDEISIIVANAAVGLISNIKGCIKESSMVEVVNQLKLFFDTIGVPMDAPSIEKVFSANWTEEDAVEICEKIMKELEE